MVDSKIVQYIRDTLSEGYTEKQMREALVKQGWYREEIDEAFAVAGPGKTDPAQPARQPKATHEGKKPSEPGGIPVSGRGLPTSFVLSVAGGALIIINSLLVFMGFGGILQLFLSNFSISFLEMFDVTLSCFDAVLINIIIGGFLIGTSYILYIMPDRSKITGMFMVALSLITIMVGNGFLVGGLIAIAGGVFAVLGK